MIHVLHTVPGLATVSGGPARTVTGLTDALSMLPEMRVELLSVRPRSGAIVHPGERSFVSRHLARRRRFGVDIMKLSFRAALYDIAAQTRPDVIHDHGLWLPENQHAATASRKLRVPLVVHPRGMLEPWALQHRRFKKRLAMSLFQRRNLELADVIIATSVQEYQSVRAVGFTQPIAIIPNGVNVEPSSDSRTRIERKSPIRTALYLSRIHPKKGLLNLVAAWGRLRPTNWRLQIAGPDEGGHLYDVLSAARLAGIDGSLEYAGELDGAAKAAAYRNADLFILPTYSENFGLVVAEALAHGIPVITTKGAPWADLVAYQCGWWIDTGIEPLAAAIRAAMAMDDDERIAMGQRGREYVRRFSWSAIASRTMAVYSWMIGRGARPDCVQMT